MRRRRAPQVSCGTARHHVVLVCGFPPSTRVGGGVILRRLLEGFPGDITVVANRRAARHSGIDIGRKGPSHTVLIDPWRARTRGLRRVAHEANLLRIPALALAIWRAAHGGTILAVPWAGELGSELFLSAWLASLLGETPLVVYELDEWDAALTPLGRGARSRRVLARALHRRVLRKADTVWAVSPPLAETLEVLSGRNVEVLASLVDLRVFQPEPSAGRPVAMTPCRIVFLGAVYNAQLDAIVDVVRAVERCPVPMELVLYTNDAPEGIDELGIGGGCVVVEPHASQDALPSILASATVLLLPYSFRRELRAIVTTSFPTKTAEYLASGTPVLVHAPAYASISQLARDEGWAAVVDTTDLGQLARVLERIATDDAYRAELSARAVAIARQRHDLHALAPRFHDALRAPRRRRGARSGRRS